MITAPRLGMSKVIMESVSETGNRSILGQISIPMQLKNLKENIINAFDDNTA